MFPLLIPFPSHGAAPQHQTIVLPKFPVGFLWDVTFGTWGYFQTALPAEHHVRVNIFPVQLLGFLHFLGLWGQPELLAGSADPNQVTVPSWQHCPGGQGLTKELPPGWTQNPRK